jgi:hypothetical protein
MRNGKISNPAEPWPKPATGPAQQTYDIRISRDGAWFHESAPIGRLPLVKLFSSVLQRDEQGDYWLVTPFERGRIVVEDAPFVAVELRAEGSGMAQSLSFRTNVDDWVTAGADHPIRLADPAGDPALSESPPPYILVRDRLEARIVRSVFYELVDLAVERETARGVELGVWSKRMFFPLGMLAQAEPPA